MQKDVRWLRNTWRRLAQAQDSDPQQPRLQKQYQTRLTQSTQTVQARAAQRPHLEFDPELPITRWQDEIVDAIEQHPVVIVAGETGSGKSTQLPKMAIQAGRGRRGLIGCTQPRRIAARSVARRVAEELDTKLGELVGFQVRFNETVSDNSLIKFMTDG
ncbi:MAG: ATP-dependent helicase, partial [Pseudomonadota bacterium]